MRSRSARHVVVMVAAAIALSGCMQAWQPRRYLGYDESAACGAWDVDCSPAAYGSYGCGPSGCGTPVTHRVAK